MMLCAISNRLKPIQNQVLFIFFTVLVCFAYSSFSQTNYKFEKEKQIDETLVPQPAVDFVNALGAKEVKWYQETAINEITIEAKTELNNQLHSIEFGSDGVLQDVEVLICADELPSQVRHGAKEYLESNFEDYRLQKIQRQWSGDKDQVIKQILDASSLLEPKFELVAKVKLEAVFLQKEFLFSSDGQLISESTILEKNNDIFTY